MPEAEPQASLCRPLAGITFEVRCASHRLWPVDLPGYRAFSATTPTLRPVFPPVEVACRVASAADCPAQLPERFLDGGAWGYYAGADEAVFFAPLPQSGLAARWCARVPRGGARRIDVACSNALLTSGEGEPFLADPFRYPLDQIVLGRALGSSGLLLHAAGACRQGRALVFPGVSGAGKTTLSRLLHRDGFTLLSDDRVVVRCDAGAFSAWGTPWPGEGGFARNEAAPLAGLCFLRKGAAFSLRQLSPREAYPLMLKVASVPWYDPDAVAGPLESVAALLRGVPVYELTFRPEEETRRRFAQLIDGDGFD